MHQVYGIMRKIRSQGDAEENLNHDESLLTSMKVAARQGKLEKYLEFLERVQKTAEQQIKETQGPCYDPSSSPVRKILQRNRELAKLARS
jgi:hypothetical protein